MAKSKKPRNPFAGLARLYGPSINSLGGDAKERPVVSLPKISLQSIEADGEHQVTASSSS